jgi:hypothetical protein
LFKLSWSDEDEILLEDFFEFDEEPEPELELLLELPDLAEDCLFLIYFSV